jgi:sugar phosphate isomerase/epimerase
MRPISLAALTVLGLSPDEQIICAERTGYESVGLRLIPATPTEAHYPLLQDAPRIAKVKDLMRSTGIKVLDIEVFRLEPKTNINDFIPYLELGADLGSKNVLVAGYDPDWVRMTENWIALCEISRDFDIKPHIEPMPWTNVKTYLDALSLMRQSPDEWGAVLIDPIHFFRTGGDVNQINFDDTKRFRYIQLSDATLPVPESSAEILRQARQDRLPPGQGKLALKDLLRNIPSNLPISLEVPLGSKWSHHTIEEKARIVLECTLNFLQN